MIKTLWAYQCNCEEKDPLVVQIENKKKTKTKDIVICSKCMTRIAREDLT